MSKKLWVLTLTILFTLAGSFAYSQEKPLKFGILGGLNMTTTNIEIPFMDSKIRPGLGIGGILEYWISQKFGIHADAMYNMKGAKYDFNLSFMGASASAELNWKFAYLSFPILGKLAFGDRTRFILDFGPEFSFLLSAKQQAKVDAMGQKEEEEIDIKEHMNSFEFAFDLGLGVEFLLGNTTLFIESRGSVSLNDIFKDKEFGEGKVEMEDKAAANIAGSLRLGVLF